MESSDWMRQSIARLQELLRRKASREITTDAQPEIYERVQIYPATNGLRASSEMETAQEDLREQHVRPLP